MIDKTTFCEVIEMLRQQMIFDRRIGESIQEAFGVQHECSYRDNLLVQALMKMLWIHFPKDEDGHCEIEDYCFILEFGKIGNIITAEDLYDSLTQKN